jgi:hypothetical protein
MNLLFLGDALPGKTCSRHVSDALFLLLRPSFGHS